MSLNWCFQAIRYSFRAFYFLALVRGIIWDASAGCEARRAVYHGNEVIIQQTRKNVHLLTGDTYGGRVKGVREQKK